METNAKNAHHLRTHSIHGGLRFSIILIVVGLVFLAVNTGLLPTIYQPLFTSWPIWLIFGGLYFLLDCSWFSGLTLLTAGTFFIIPQIGDVNPALNIPDNFAHLYWPALLVIAGIYFLSSRFLKPSWCSYGPFCHHGPFQHGSFHHNMDTHNTSFSSEEGFLFVKTAFDSRKNIVMDPIFKGGNIESAFGEVIVDLRKTALQEGKSVLSVNVSFGSAQIIVPSGWNVQVNGDSFFGTFTDSRLSPTFNPVSSSTLVIEGKCAFGECKLRD